MVEKPEFHTFVQTLAQDVKRWKGSVSEIDISSLSDLSYDKGKVMDDSKNVCLKQLKTLEDDVQLLSKKISLTNLVVVLVDLENTQVSLSELDATLDDENEKDVDAYMKWKLHLGQAFAEAMADTKHVYGALIQISKALDSRFDVSQLSKPNSK